MRVYPLHPDTIFSGTTACRSGPVIGFDDIGMIDSIPPYRRLVNRAWPIK
jgi:hypothetical protein